MKKRLVFVLAIVFVLMITGCGNSNKAEEPNGANSQTVDNTNQIDTEEYITEGVADYPAAIMVNDTIYLLEEEPMSAEVDESAIIGYTESYTDTFPENNGETNFNRELGMPYAQVEGGIAVLYENEWYLGTPNFNMADVITFTGIIIDHTLESVVPVICVKTLEEEIIPYESVFFELPDDEADWALQIGAVVTITCANTFTEQAPYFGTLISITGLTTETDNFLISVASVWDKERVIILSAEDAAMIANLVESGSWTKGTGDCANDCIIFMNEEDIKYHSDCGTFNDTVNEKRLHLTEEQQAEVNAVLEKYIKLGLEIDNYLISFTEEQIEEAKQAALAYYADTVFTVNNIEYFNGDLSYGGDEDCCNFTVNVSKDGVVQEPDRTISLKLDNGIWEVVNEGY